MSDFGVFDLFNDAAILVRTQLLFNYSDKLNPHIYNRVKSIDLELGGSDDEDIASKTTLVIRGP